eukprot:TRINITY_DN1831_c0_g1_i2.p1 TRINITY_DN1831_c0_g1~~TRINITY_DN1831_c0_g1_i2.p1  ORF type:complete len:109 (+),score=23.55 TRINITY_DN1831_c0_g1_i2:39-365(+)
MSWFARPTRVVNDIHPFTSIHRRSERRIIPQIRNGRVAWYVAASIFLSAVAQEVLRPGAIPRTFTDEWKAKEAEYDEAQWLTAISGHKVGTDPVVPTLLMTVPQNRED